MRIALMVAQARVHKEGRQKKKEGMWRNLPIPLTCSTSRIADTHAFTLGERDKPTRHLGHYNSVSVTGKWEGGRLCHLSRLCLLPRLTFGAQIARNPRDWLWKWTDYSKVSDLAGAKHFRKLLPKLLVRRRCRRTSENSVSMSVLWSCR